MTLTDAIRWTRTATAGDYLITYDDSGLTHDEDPGSRCGFGDAELAAIEQLLEARDLTLTADDRGLVAAAADSARTRKHLDTKYPRNFYLDT